jgi:hypothetical protein
MYLVFSGSTECIDIVNNSIDYAVEHGIEDIDMTVIENTVYEFPWWLFTCGSNMSLVSLCLSFCKLSPPLEFVGLSSLMKLALIRMHMSLKETQLVPGCCRNISFCKFCVLLKFGGFSCLMKLALIRMHMSLKETQLLGVVET